MAEGKKSSNFDGIAILAVIIIIMIITPKEPYNSSNSKVEVPGSTLSSSGSQVVNSSYTRPIYLGPGNASYSYQPYEEYITIENSSREAVNLSGWQLRNGKDRRTYELGGQAQRFSADVAILPNVTLAAGERAVVTTGKPLSSIPNIFKENKCTGYLEASPDYAFQPSLSRSCSSPWQEPGIEGLPRECQDMVKRLSSCETPQFQVKDRNGESCTTCINGERLGSSCAAYVKAHFSYQGCLAYHQGDPNFHGKTWRIFLGRSWEMWADDYESIELYDNLGRLVDYETY